MKMTAKEKKVKRSFFNFYFLGHFLTQYRLYLYVYIASSKYIVSSIDLATYDDYPVREQSGLLAVQAHQALSLFFF
jgi:hypothetical protein